MTRLIEQQGGYEEWVLAPARHLLADLVAHDDWLPKLFAMPDPEHHREYLLYGDPLDRFSLVSFVWGAGQKTPVHDHLTWGLMGVLRGGLDEVSYRFGGRDGELIPSRTTRLTPGLVSAVSPNLGDIHMLSHLVGSANRADIRRLAEIEAENARLTDTIHRQQTLLHEGAVEHRREIERLERLLADRLSRAYQNISKDTFNASADVEQVLARMQTKLDREIAHRRKCERDRDLLREERDAAAADLRAAMARAAESRAEVVTLEAYMDATEPNGGGAQDAALDGLGLLYVGGRSGRANQLRLAAGKRGALLEIHDGGQQEASSLLSGLIARADVVFFPVDFVSHEAALSIKRQCKQAGKPYVPLPSAGLGCFITALERRWLDGTGRLGVDI